MAKNPAIWLHSVTVDNVQSPDAKEGDAPAGVQLTIQGESQDGGAFEQIIGMPAALFSDICHRMRTNP